MKRFLMALVATLALTAPSALAVTGDLDATYGNAGITRFDPPAGYWSNEVSTMAAQADGKLLVSRGLRTVESNPGATLTRLNANGTVDTTFGNNGSYDFPAKHLDWISEIKIQADQKIVFAGNFENNIMDNRRVLVRLNPDGTLDTDTDSTPSSCFGPSCSGYIDLPTSEPGGIFLSSFAVRDDGDLIVAGWKYNGPSDSTFGIKRFDEHGNPRTAYNANADTFGNALKPSVFGVTRVLLSEDQSEAVLAFADKDEHFAAAKLDADGSPVTSWGTGGVARVPANWMMMSGADMRNGVVALTGTGASYADSGVALLDANGHTPAGYGQDGVAPVTLPAGVGGSAEEVELTPDGRALVLLKIYNSETFGSKTATAMLMPTGTPDVTYGVNGVVGYPALVKVDPSALVLLPFGKALIGGVTVADGGHGIAVVARAYGTLEPPLERMVVSKTPTSQIGSPSKSKISARKLKKLSGTAGPAGSVAKVEVALQRVDKSLLKKKKRCLWLRSSSAKFARIVAIKKSCAAPKWLKASGTESWSYKLKRKLPRGNYVLRVRTTLTDGTVQSRATHKSFKVT